VSDKKKKKTKKNESSESCPLFVVIQSIMKNPSENMFRKKHKEANRIK
jgi:hypothetical protein